MGNPLVDKTATDVVISRQLRGDGLCDRTLFLLPLFAVSQQIEWVTCAHDAGPGQGECHP